MNTRNLTFGLVAIVTIGASSIAFVACSSEGEDPRPPSTTFKVDSSTPDQGPDLGTPDLGTPDLGTPDTSTPDVPDLGTPDTAGCVTDAGCFACKPSKPLEFLNQCTGSQCAKFDDGKRIPSWDGGKLPPVP